MRLDIRQSSLLPKLAWVARHQGSSAVIICGQSVRTFPSGVFEGGWALVDTPENCSPKGWYAGSGIFVSNGNLVAIAPSHTLESIYVVRRNDITIVSNSMALAVVEAGMDSFRISEAGGLLWSISMGLQGYPRKIAERNGATLYRYSTSVINLTTQVEHEHVPDYHFADYGSYRAFLERVLTEVFETSGSDSCTTYLSRGYDSVACAALAASLGGGKALSLPVSRTKLDDDGSPIAELLGLSPNLISPVDRPKYVKDGQTFTHFDEADAGDVAEFCVGFGIEDECLLVDPHLVSETMVLTGFHGDKAWDLATEPSLFIKRGDSSGSSLYEFRLRAGFVHVPVPMIGILRHNDLHRIARSEEMARWRIGGNYDRPIPRRIAEDAGVPREMFGQRKSAAATAAEPLGMLKDVYFDALMTRYRTAVSALGA